MVWATKSALSATELANRALDLPLIIGRNWTRYSTATMKWTAAGGDGDADISVAAFEARHCGDDFDHLLTKPSSGDPRYLNINLGSTVGEIDCLAIKNHNLFTVSATLKLQLSTDAPFTTPIDILTITPGSNKRIVEIDLRESGDANPQRFTGVRYARLFIDMPSAGVPTLGEVFLGRSRQLYSHSLLPHAPYRLTSGLRVGESEAGIVGGVSRATNRRRFAFTYVTKDATAISDWEALFRDDCDGGSLPYLYVEKPNTARQNALWIWPDLTDIEGESAGYSERRFRLLGREQGPNFLAKGVGT